MNKQELIERIEGLKNIFGNKCEYVKIDFMIKLVSELDEPQKPVVPQFVADWLEKCKNEEKSLLKSLLYTPQGVNSWVESSENQETFARAWILGYTVEKEKLYQVRLKKIAERMGYLNRLKGTSEFMISYPEENNLYATKFTRKELEDAGFSEVFNSPLFEVVEVE